MKRRDFLRAGSAALVAAAGNVDAQGIAQGLAGPQDITPFIEAVTHGKKPERGGIEIEIPPLAENGNSVPLTLRVTSPMSAEDHVVAVHVFAERNPRPHVATFHLGPQSGRAQITTRIRLAGTQNLTVLAELSNDRFRIMDAPVLVTSAACLDETAG